jgi:citrate lyase subunit beta / citryl-CoA lyase
VLHPGQVEPVNQVFSPDQEAYDRAELILDADAHATDVRQTGAVMLGDEMIDEASRKLALVTAAKGRAAGLARTRAFDSGPAAASAEHTPGGERFGQAAGQG